MHTEALLRHIQAYSAPCVAITYSQSCHILSPGISRTRVIFKTMRKFDKTYSEPCHRTVYLALFCHVQTYSASYVTLSFAETCHIWNPGIFSTLMHIQKSFMRTRKDKYCVTLEIQNLGILTILKYWGLWHLKSDTYSELFSKFLRASVLQKWLKAIIIFSKLLYFKPLTGLWMCSSLRKYLLTCRVDFRLCIVWDIVRTLSIIINSDILSDLLSYF